MLKLRELVSLQMWQQSRCLFKSCLQMRIKSYQLKFVCDIKPEMENGSIFNHSPQNFYKNHKILKLNSWGDGSFCKFRIPYNLNKKGVYVLKLDSENVYVGRCVDLSKRFNTGYGQISPRNCYVGGQTTNCRINKAILCQAEGNSQIQLYFYETANHKAVEQDLLASCKWLWNIQGSSNKKK